MIHLKQEASCGKLERKKSFSVKKYDFMIKFENNPLIIEKEEKEGSCRVHFYTSTQ